MARRINKPTKRPAPRRTKLPACRRAARHAGGDSLARLGLQPAQDHPDAGLFQLLEQERRLAEAWTGGSEWADTTACIGMVEQIAGTPAKTLVGLLEKADRALLDWRMDSGERLCPIASALAEACAVLRLFGEAEVAARRRRG